MTPETKIKNEILVALSGGETRLWNNPVGVGQITKGGKTYTVKYGLAVGSSDLIGLKGGRFVAIEVKTKTGRVSDEQWAFIKMVNDLGGIAGVCRSVDDARQLIYGE